MWRYFQKPKLIYNIRSEIERNKKQKKKYEKKQETNGVKCAEDQRKKDRTFRVEPFMVARGIKYENWTHFLDLNVRFFRSFARHCVCSCVGIIELSPYIYLCIFWVCEPNNIPKVKYVKWKRENVMSCVFRISFLISPRYRIVYLYVAWMRRVVCADLILSFSFSPMKYV